MKSSYPVPDSHPDAAAARAAARRTHVQFTILVVAGLAVRVALVHFRWINPDEGAHLMDGRLVQHGLLPAVDFNARQPFYVYVLAFWLQLTGGGFEAVRVLMALLDTGVGALTYAIGLRIMPPRAALLAAALYLLLPFTIIWAPIVHTEPLTMVLVAAGILGLVRRLTGGGVLAVVGAGACFALGYYVRQSALAGVLTAVALLLLFRRPRLAAARDAGWLAVGFGSAVLVALAWYARRLTPAELWRSDVNPLRLPITSLMQIAGVSSGGTSGFRSEIQTWSTTFDNLRSSVGLSALLVAGALVFLVRWALLERRAPAEAAPMRLAVALVAGWVGSLGVLYGYWLLHRGFYPQYAVELLPPLALGAGYALTSGWAAADRPTRWRVGGVLLAALVPALALHGAVPDKRYTPMLYAALAGVVTLAAAPRSGRRRLVTPLAAAAAAAAVVWLAIRWIVQAPVHPADAIAAATVIAGTAIAAWTALDEHTMPAELASYGIVGALGAAMLVFSARTLSLHYSCVWAPATVRDVVTRLREQLPADGTVMSGGVIWEFAAGRLPFAAISHPLAFQGGGDPASGEQIDSALVVSPPAAIVLDGYTELTYIAQSQAVARVMHDRYEEVAVVYGSRYPVRILRPRS